MKTIVIHIQDAPPDWRMDFNFVYIGRGSKWGNNYSHLYTSKALHQVSIRDKACDMFEQHQLPNLLPSIRELMGKFLVCYCKPKRCHGDLLAEIANSNN